MLRSAPVPRVDPARPTVAEHLTVTGNARFRAIPDDDLLELLDTSYDAIVAKLPKSRPLTHGTDIRMICSPG